MMLTHIWSAFTGIFSLSGLLGVIVGSAVTRLWYWVGDRIADRREPGKPHHTYFNNIVALWMLLFAVMGYIGFQQQEAGNALRALAASTQECSRQFNAALKVRAQLNDESDALAKVQRDALATWLHQIVNPPEDIASIRANDPNFGENPRYVQWSIDITTKFDQEYNAARQQQDETDARRPQYPEPTCGQN